MFMSDLSSLTYLGDLSFLGDLSNLSDLNDLNDLNDLSGIHSCPFSFKCALWSEKHNKAIDKQTKERPMIDQW